MSLRRTPSKPPSSQGGPPQYTPASFDPPHATFTPSLSKMTVSPSPSASLGCGGCGGKKKEHDKKDAYDDEEVHVRVKKNDDGFEVVVRGKLSHDSSSDEEASTPCSREKKHHTPCSKKETPCGSREDTPCYLRTYTYGSRSTDSPCSRKTSPCGSGKEDSPCFRPRPPTPPTPTSFEVPDETSATTTLVRATDDGMGGKNDTPSFEYHIHFTDTEMDAFQYDLCKKTVLAIEALVEEEDANAKSILIFGGDCVDIELRRGANNAISDVLTQLLRWKKSRGADNLDTVLMIGNRDGNKIRLSEHVDMIYPGQADYDSKTYEDIASQEFVVPDETKHKRMKTWIKRMFEVSDEPSEEETAAVKVMACFLRLCFIVNATMGATQNFSKAVECQVCSGFMAYLFLKSKVALDEKSLLFKIAIEMSGRLEDMAKAEDKDFEEKRWHLTNDIAGKPGKIQGFVLKDFKTDAALKKMVKDAKKVLDTTRQWIGQGDMRKYLEEGNVFYYYSKDKSEYDVACVHAGMMAGPEKGPKSVYDKVPMKFNKDTGRIEWEPASNFLGKGPTNFSFAINEAWYRLYVKQVLDNSSLEREDYKLNLKRMLVALAGPNNEGPLYTKDKVAKPFVLEKDASKPIAWFLGHQPNAVPMFGRSDSYNMGCARLPSEKGLVVRTDTQYKRPSFCVAATFPYEHGTAVMRNVLAVYKGIAEGDDKRVVEKVMYADLNQVDQGATPQQRQVFETQWMHKDVEFWCGPKVVLPDDMETAKQYRAVMWNHGFDAGVFLVPDIWVEKPEYSDPDPFLTVAFGVLVVRDSIKQNLMVDMKTNENYNDDVGQALLSLDTMWANEMKAIQLPNEMMALPYICTSEDRKLGRRLKRKDRMKSAEGGYSLPPYFQLDPQKADMCPNPY